MNGKHTAFFNAAFARSPRACSHKVQMVTTLRHPGLRIRDMRRILSHKRSGIVWEAGTSAGSEWVYATLEDASHRQRLDEWLASKGIADSAEAFVFVDGHYECSSTTQGEIRAHPEKFFDGRQIQIVSKDIDWRLDYREQCVARFGRWKSAVQPDHLTSR